MDEEAAVVFDRYRVITPETAENELFSELVLQLSPTDDPELAWGCYNCHRPIGYGGEFLTHIVRTLDLANVVYLDDPPYDDVYYMEDGLRIMCRCGTYVGYMDTAGRVLLGLFASLNDVYYNQ